MKKKWSKALSLALAVSMCANGVSVTTDNGAKVVAATKKKQAATEKKGEALKTSKKETKAYAEGQAIVMYRNNEDTVKGLSLGKAAKDISIERTCDFSDTTKAKNSVSAKSNKQSKNNFSVSLVKSSKYTTKELIKKLAQEDNVLAVEPNYTYQATGTADYSKYLWGLDNKGQNGGTENEDINLDAVSGEQSSDKERVVAVIDTGINYKNDDLKNVVWNNPYTDQLKGEHGYDFYNIDADPLDDNGHGSHCSGIIAGDSTDGKGIRGVASGNTKIMALKFLDEDGSGYGFDAICAYNYIYKAQQLGVNVVAVNNSWGGSTEETDEILKQIIDMVGEKGAVTVCAASNDSEDNDSYDVSPANIDSPYIITVAASNEKGELANFSNYGKESVEIAAPGTDILSTVSEDTFTPSIYENKDELCGYYNDFSKEFAGSIQDDNEENTVETDLSNGKFNYTVVKDGDGEVTFTKETKEFFGTKSENSASAKLSIKGAQEGETYYLYLPYDAKKSDTPIYQNFMFKAESPDIDWYTESPSYISVGDVPVASGGSIETLDDGKFFGYVDIYNSSNYWDQISFETWSKVKKSEQRALVYAFIIEKDGDYALYFDDVAYSKANVKSEEFGQYAFYNGTSMAAPYVTGTVALTKGLYPDESAIETRARVIGSATKKEALKDKVSTGGVVDLSKIKNPSPVVFGGSISADGVVTVDGKFFGQDSTVTVNGNAVDVISRTDSSISFKGAYDTKLDVKVEKNGYTSEKEFFFVSGTDMKKKGVSVNNWRQGSVVTDGDKLYYVTNDGGIISYDVDNKNSYMDLSKMDMYENAELPMLYGETKDVAFEQKEIFGEDTETIVVYDLYSPTNAVSLGKQLYTVARMDVNYSEENALVTYDTKEAKWVKVADIPKEYVGVEKITMASYAGKLYLIGGFNTDKEKSIATVYSYDLTTKTWTKVADMPEGRYGAKAVATNNKLVVTLGGNENGGCKTNYIFDGTAWTKGADLEGVVDTATYSYSIPYEEGMKETDDIEVNTLFETASKKMKYYDAAVGATDAGVIYTGIRVNGMGNTFSYDLASNSFKNETIKLTTNSSEDTVYGATIGNTFYTLSGQEYEEELDYYLFLYNNGNGVTANNVQEESGHDYGFGKEADELIFISSTDVKHKTVEVKEKATENAYKGVINGLGKYEIGDTITLTAVPGNDYYLKALYVNGKKVQNGYTVTATEDLDGMTVYAEYGEYVTSIEMLTKDTIVAGESKTLTAMTFPTTATDQTLIWSSSDTSVVKVDSTGKITAGAKAAGKSATITVVAADRKKVVATCKVTVKSKVAVKSIKLTASKKTVKAGKSVTVKATVSPKNATSAKVKWTSSKKKYATVNSKGKVTTKKAGKGHTVTITATSVSNPTVKGKIKIKIK